MKKHRKKIFSIFGLGKKKAHRVNTKSKIFLDLKTDKLDLITIKNFYSVKGPVKRMKRQITDKEKIFSNHISEKN